MKNKSRKTIETFMLILVLISFVSCAVIVVGSAIS